MEKVLLETDLPFKKFKQGKVRDIYELDDRLLIIATDRISAFDVVMGQGIPGRGEVLTQLSKFWFGFIENERIVKTHFISDRLPQEIKGRLRKELFRRIMVVKKTKVIPVEWIVRGYLAGSAWKKYQKNEGLKKIWPNLVEGQKLPLPVIEQTTKAETGHDQDLDSQGLWKILKNFFKENGFDQWNPIFFGQYLASKSLDIYNQASKYTEERGIIIADTKFEFGINSEGNIILVDEVLTPDSSRFWLKEKWQPGKPQEAYDKQPLRDWLESTGWPARRSLGEGGDKNPPPPDLPKDLINAISQRYQKIFKMLTS